MKWIGFLLVTVGFVIAALATVVDQSAIESISSGSPDESTVESTDAAAAAQSPIKWLKV